MLQIPWVAGGGPRQVEGRAAVRKFVRLQLAKQDRTRVQELARRCRVFLRHLVDADLRAAGSEYAFGVVNILERERNAVQRSPVPTLRDLALSCLRLSASGPFRKRDERVHLRFERFDALQQCVGQLDRRKRARAYELSGLSKGEIVQFGAHR